MLDNELLFSYWHNQSDPARANQIVQEALRELPSSAKVAARALQVADRIDLADAWRERVNRELVPHLAQLRLRLRQVDRLGDPNNEPTVLFEELGDEVEGLNLERFDTARLRSVRLGAGHRAKAAKNFLTELGLDVLPARLSTALHTAVTDLEGQIDRGEAAQALLVGPDGAGFVIGLHFGFSDQAEITTAEDVERDLHVAATTALKEVLNGRGARYGMEWALPFQGSSIGLPMAVAALVTMGLVEPDPLTAATGHVVAGGAIAGVGGIESKLAAAAAVGLQRVLLPEENRSEAEAAAPPELELRFVSNVSQLRQAAAPASTGTEVGIAAKKRIVRVLSRSIGFEVSDEKPIDNGYQIKLTSLSGHGTISIYNSGAVVVGAGGAAKAGLEAFAAELLRDPAPETRESLVLRLPGDALQAKAREELVGLNADVVDTKQHERWRLRLTRGKSAASAVLYNSGKLVVQGTAPAHDEVRAALAPLLSGLAGSEALTAPPAAERVRQRREAAAHEPWIGTDESGKGDYFGPLVSTAVYVDRSLAAQLEELGVRDSKKLSDARVHSLAPQLTKLLGKRTRTTVIQPARYNSLYREMRAEGKNLNSLLAWGHYRSVLDLLRSGAKPGYLIVDQFADVRYIEGRLAADAERHDMEILQFPKAEADVAVAAASILAREAFLRWLERESEASGVRLPKGAGDQAVEAAKELVDRHGGDALGRYAKVSFRTTEKVLE